MRPQNPANLFPEASCKKQVIPFGWTVAIIIPTSFLVDNGASLTYGIFGLMNKGEFRNQEG